jgi:hypothetical protein
MGEMRARALSLVSRTRARIAGVDRVRRGRSSNSSNETHHLFEKLNSGLEGQ